MITAKTLNSAATTMPSLSVPARPGHGLLRCPICRLEFIASGGTLACSNRHSFDLARSGYVNLIHGRRRQPAGGGDNAHQLRHRASFLDAGHFDAVDETMARHVKSVTEAVGKCWRVLDLGCGTGHHLGKMAAALEAPVVGLGLDISPEAGRHAARRWPELAFAIADVWREWPVRDAVADLVISVLAPKNFPETARVLRPGGVFAMAYPGPNHLIELRQFFGLMRQHEKKADRYATAVAQHIGSPAITRFVRRKKLNAAAVRDAILMGPNALRATTAAVEIGAETLHVTFDMVILFARKGSAIDRNASVQVQAIDQ
jgi:23S rRNA (guanine745-N1)-methyltransferase